MACNFTERLASSSFPKELLPIFQQMYLSYQTSFIEENLDLNFLDPLFTKYLDLILANQLSPYIFPPYHKKIRDPLDYYQFGMDFIRPLVKIEESIFRGDQYLDQIVDQIDRNENVILLANHQTEPDPQAINLLIEKRYPKLGEDMIFVAGHRVTTDPLVVPFSLGRNLLCIYSKKYIDHPPEEKHNKIVHNQRTIKKMGELLSEGGKCIYVAPSGGRDRPNSTGTVELSPFDPQSIELFALTAKHSTKPTHFYPLALKTADLFPPPGAVKIEIGEQRLAKRTPIGGAIGAEVDVVNFPGSESVDRIEKRQKRADHIWELVSDLYRSL